LKVKQEMIEQLDVA